MSLYRQPGALRRRTVAAAVVVALLVGGGAGWAIGHGGRAAPSAKDVVAHVAERLRPVRDGLSLVPTEYPQAYRGAGNERAAVTGDLGRIRGGLDAALPDLRVLDPAGARDLDAAVRELEDGVRRRAAPAQVARLAGAARQALSEVPGGR